MLAAVLTAFLAFGCCAGIGEVVPVPSKAMQKRVKCTIVLPASYDQDTLKRFPVMYLLHGYSGDNLTLVKVLPLAQWADSFQTVFICIDGDYSSWYLDSPVKKGSLYETFIVNELMPWVDARVHVRASREGRAIAGTSMGGQGALAIIARHPDLFCAAGGISGVYDLTEFPNQWGIESVLGPLESNRQRWRDNSFVNLAPRLAGKDAALMLITGSQDFSLNGNRGAHEMLREHGIAHEYREYPGDHTYHFVKAHGRELVAFLAAKLTPAGH
jgi:S-formylglutathione hydrolase FrmB